jgi:uncharacterized repeat protein (TIGR02543 family)
MDSTGKVYEKLPQASTSIQLAATQEGIKASKQKTAYYVGDSVDTDDITVIYTDENGNKTTLARGDYKVNASSVNNRTTGTKKLPVSYSKDGKTLTYDITLIFTAAPTAGDTNTTYTATFVTDYGTAPAAQTGIRMGGLVQEPMAPTATGYRFQGWYSDAAHTRVWNFATDTVQSNVTLYASWMKQQSATSLCVAEIPEQTYTGKAIKPSVKVYASDGITLLKAGKDYTISYENNMNANKGSTAAIDATYGYDRNKAWAVITGKGNYGGVLYQNFTIAPFSIGSEEDVAAGVTLKYTDQYESGTKTMKPFTSLKYIKTLQQNTDFTLQISTVNAVNQSGQSVTAGTTLGTEIPAGYSGTFQMVLTGQ